jgi:two-component system CheB/CheR fusion protein
VEALRVLVRDFEKDLPAAVFIVLLLKGGPSLEDFSAAFLGRLRAMADTHELLSRGNWTGARLRVLIEAALGPELGRDNPAIALHGADLVLAPGTAATLGLVFYELATNAMKRCCATCCEARVASR